jgi:hypothetical protein
MAAHRTTPEFLLALLKLSPFERSPRGGWRFGTRRISDGVVANLIASGRAEMFGERLQIRAQPLIVAAPPPPPRPRDLSPYAKRADMR